MTSVACLCGGVAVTVQLKSLTDHTCLQLCHCTNCRTVTGLLNTSYYLLDPELEPPTPDVLQEYRQPDHMSRFFCRTCGAHVFARLHSGSYVVASGVLAAEHHPPVRKVQHLQVAATGDGGLSTFISGEVFPVWGCRSSCGSEHFQSPVEEPVDCQQELQARCHCGGIEFYITRPDASSAQASSPWPDLLVPYHSGSSANPDDVKWWLRDGQTRYLAGTCACPSCRLGSGFPIQTWAFIPKTNIFNADRSPLAFDLGTMKRYTSSPGVYREFCSRCGATVFWHCEERPMVIDVSVGLFRGGNARAEDWLEWATGRVSFAEMAVQKDLVQLLEDGLRKYGGV